MFRGIPDRVEFDHTAVVLDPMIPEWDILIEIQEAKKKLPQIRLEYVKGHQDRNKPFASLPLLAQLNVEADKMAGKYHELNQPQVKHVIMSPRARVHVESEKGTVTSNYEEVIRQEVGTPPSMTWMRERNSWEQETANQINWSAHGKALKRCPKKRNHLIKLVHDILPTTSQHNSFDDGHRTCPLCTGSKEDVEHIILCMHPTRVEWRQTFLEAVKDFCKETKTHHDIQQLLLQALGKWTTDDGTVTTASSYPEEVQAIITQQQLIGWGQLLRGRFGTKWSEYQAQHYNRIYNNTEVPGRWTGERWQVSLISLIWDKWYDMWQSRNQDLHGRDAIGRRSAERRELRRQLERIYAQRSLMEPRVQNLLMDNVEAHNEQPQHVAKNWLRINQAIFRASVRRIKTLALRGVRSIRTYFSTVGVDTANDTVDDTGH